VLDVFLTEELVGKKKQSTTKRLLIERRNREERRLNLELEDETGSYYSNTSTTAPRTSSDRPLIRLRKCLSHQNQIAIRLSAIAKVTDVYIPSRKLWVSDLLFCKNICL